MWHYLCMHCIVKLKFNCCSFVHFDSRMFIIVYTHKQSCKCSKQYFSHRTRSMSCFKSLPNVLALLVVLLLCRYSTPIVNHHDCSPPPPSAITVPNVESGIYDKWRPSNRKQNNNFFASMYTGFIYTMHVYSPSTTNWKMWHRLIGNVQCLPG